MVDPTDVSTEDTPEPKEEYQRKLKAFLAEIPPLGGAEIKSGSPPLTRLMTRDAFS